MFDPQRFVDLVRGGLLDFDATAAAYREENAPWLATVLRLTAPLLVTAMIVAGLIAWLLNSGPQFGGFGFWLLTLVLYAVQFAVGVGIFTALAQPFGGRRDFDRGTAAMSLATIPAYAGTALGTLPWFGWLIALVLAFRGLVCAYRIVPEHLEVPAARRFAYFVVSLLATIVVSFVIASVIGVGAYMDVASERFEPDRRAPTTEAVPGTRGGGFIGEMQRQGEIYAAAEADRYEPPDNGRLERAQVEEYIRVMTRASAMQDEYAERMKALSEEMENKENASFSDLMKVYRGVGGAVSMANAAMEIVKTSGGNWAEHVWVEEQLRIARYQPDANEAAARNRKLYDEYAEQLDEVGAF